jgi:hypothetical protein
MYYKGGGRLNKLEVGGRAKSGFDLIKKKVTKNTRLEGQSSMLVA